MLYLCTGCQGEPRAAMARIASRSHPHVVLERGDTAIFSSKEIPGNEKAIGRIHNSLVAAGVEVIGERDGRVHVSGHPNRDELARMYQWARPRIAVPVHGELRHLMEHARFARELQVPEALVAENGQVMRLAPGPAEIVAEVQAGRLYVDGRVMVDATDAAVRSRRRMMNAGLAVIALVLDEAGLAAPPSVLLQGIATGDAGEGELEAEVAEAAEEALDRLPDAALLEDDRVREAVRTGARRVLRPYTDKRPPVEVQIVRLGRPRRKEARRR